MNIAPHAEGSLLAVRAQPGAKRSAVVGLHGAALKVAVTAPADRGKANAALVEVLAQALRLKKSQVVLASGPTRRDKTFLIRGLDPASLAALVQGVLDG